MLYTSRSSTLIFILILARLRLSSRRNGPDQGALLQNEATLMIINSFIITNIIFMTVIIIIIKSQENKPVV